MIEMANKKDWRQLSYQGNSHAIAYKYMDILEIMRSCKYSHAFCKEGVFHVVYVSLRLMKRELLDNRT
jgi:hypothetical protein